MAYAFESIQRCLRRCRPLAVLFALLAVLSGCKPGSSGSSCVDCHDPPGSGEDVGIEDRVLHNGEHLCELSFNNVGDARFLSWMRLDEQLGEAAQAYQEQKLGSSKAEAQKVSTQRHEFERRMF